jgi:histidine triad (HIT) family protein
MAFMDIQPVNPGHLLVIPRAHSEYLSQVDPAAAARMFQVGQRFAQAVRVSGVRCEGVNLFLADGQAAGQEVMHVHLHVIPRFLGDGFGFRFGPHYRQRPERSELDAIARRIRDELRD